MSEDKRGFWARRDREENLMYVVKLITKHQPVSYSKLRELVDVSEPTLSGYIAELEEKKKLIDHFGVPTDRRKKLYRIKSKNRVNTYFRKHEMINFMGDAFIQTKWPEKWIEEALQKNIKQAFQEKFSLYEKLKMDKKERFFYEAITEDSVKEKTSETNLTIFHKGLHSPFRFTQNEGVMKVTLQFMVRFFIDFINARKDENTPVMMVLSYLPKVPRVRKGDDILKDTFESFVSWCKLFKRVDIKSVSKGTKEKLQEEYLQKYVKYYNSLRRHILKK